MTGNESRPTHLGGDRDRAGMSRLELVYLNLVKLNPGTVINGRYRIERLVGKGGFGIVFDVYDITLGTRVAIKFLNPELTQEDKKFLRVKREINIARKISDERIIKVFSLESWRGVHFLVMELVSGRSLKTILEEKCPWTWTEFKSIFISILEAAAVLHRNGIVHRDLKPANILIDEKKRIKILDFGLAKEIMDMDKTSTVGEIVGSPYYMSPEQIRGDTISYASDVYQLGLVLYRVLTNRHPFESTSTMEMISKQLAKKADPPKVNRDDLPRFLSIGIEKSLEKVPERRFRDAEAMAQFFRKEKASLTHRLHLALNRRPLKVTLIGAVLAVAVFSGFQATFGSRKIHKLVYRETVLQARNRLGIQLWKKNFSPFHVFAAYSTKSEAPLVQRTGSSTDLPFLDPGDEPMTIVILAPPPERPFPVDMSIADDTLMCRLAIVSSSGELLKKEPLTDHYDAYDYVKIARPQAFRNHGLNSRGETCVSFTIQQYQSMYPFALVYMEGFEKCVYTHPGTFSATLLERNGDTVSFMLKGINNLLGHNQFVAELTFNMSEPGRLVLRGIPSLSTDQRNNVPDEDRLFFLPFRARILENRWREEGRVRFTEQTNGDILDFHRDGHLSVGSKNGYVDYSDRIDTLRRIYTLVNMSFQEKWVKDNPQNALDLINQAGSFSIENPFLRSAILYLKGDLEITLGRYKDGGKSLQHALAVYTGNKDACERLCEMEMLRGDVPAAFARLADTHSDSTQFWGFTVFGVNLFRGYLYLHMGLFNQAEAEFDRIRITENDLTRFCQTTKDFFRGDYEKAQTSLLEMEQSALSAVDVRELRLLIGRTLLLNSGDIKRVEFLFNDIFHNSLDFAHLAELSSCYCLARSGRMSEAARSARRAFERLKQKARGDFMTRLWLFYDAYVYGLVMEMAGDRDQAEQGFRACIAANPHTELAAKAEEWLSRKQRP
ncbi:MAG: serine/threonine protein kinase [Candidatus Aminicenantes bacterium]|nr:serine/threonine protein kinase [Candidatus Aminicenantes bacterium]